MDSARHVINPMFEPSFIESTTGILRRGEHYPRVPTASAALSMSMRVTSAPHTPSGSAAAPTPPSPPAPPLETDGYCSPRHGMSFNPRN
jgi:hypothetical protein